MAILDNGLSIITVSKVRLLEALKKNLAAHEEELETARKLYQEASVLKLTQMLENAKNGKIETHTDLSPPPDNRKEYNRVISMLEFSLADEIKIQETEFRQYVLDEWSYKNTMAVVSTRYRMALSQ